MISFQNICILQRFSNVKYCVEAALQKCLTIQSNIFKVFDFKSGLDLIKVNKITKLFRYLMPAFDI